MFKKIMIADWDVEHTAIFEITQLFFSDIPVIVRSTDSAAVKRMQRPRINCCSILRLTMRQHSSWQIVRSMITR